jgi:choline dehydrogenase
VQYSIDDRTETASITSEVIVSAGVIGTPHLLKLSGIGPAGELNALGIEVVADSPGVGENLRDHLMSGVTYEANGPLPPSVNNHGEASMLLPAADAGNEPELQFLFILVPLHPQALASVEHGYTLGVALVRPRSTGSVKLASADPEDAPLIDPQYLSDDRDVAALIRGLRIAREIGSAPALDEFRLREVHPGPALTTDEELEKYLSVASDTYYHPHGTARMGTDQNAVVTPDLRVRGVQNVRVADASVIPSLAVNTNATCIMIGERLSSFLISKA